MAHVMGGISWALASNTTRAFNATGQIGGGIMSDAVRNIGSLGTLVALLAGYLILVL